MSNGVANAVNTVSSKSKKWLVAFGVMCVVIASQGINNGTISLYTSSICDTLGIERSVFSMWSTISRVVGALFALVYAVVYKKIKAKGIVAIAGFTSVAHFACFALAKDLTLIFIGGFLNGFCYVICQQLILFSIIPPWFEKGQGKVTAFISFSYNIIITFYTQIVQNIMNNSGYSMSMMTSAIIMGVLTIIALFVVDTAPNDPVAGSYAVQTSETETKAPKGNIFKQYLGLLKEPIMWGCCLMFFIISLITSPFYSMLLPMGNDLYGGNAQALANSLVYGLAIPAKFILGAIKDKWGGKPVLYICAITHVISTGCALMGGENLYYVSAAMYGISSCMSILCSVFLLQEVFGKCYDSVQLSLCVFVFQIARAVGQPIIHAPYDIFGSYNVSIWCCLILTFVMTFLTLSLFKYGKKYQLKHAEAEAQ